MFKNRLLPKRAFCFSSRTLDTVEKQKDMMVKFEDEEFKTNIIANIAYYIKNNLNKEVKESEIWIDSPQNPKFKEAIQCLIKCEGALNNYIILREVFPIDDWVRAFSENKWQGFIYTMSENCKEVAIASKCILEEIFEVKFNEFATKLCKIEFEQEA
jgi:hypothetical protein